MILQEWSQSSFSIVVTFPLLDTYRARSEVREMHKLICATATIFLSVVGLIPQVQSDSQALQELKGVAVTVRVIPKGALLESQIRAEVEQQLQAAHVPILGHPRDVLIERGKRINSFPPFLSVLVDLTPQRAEPRAYKVEVMVSQDAADVQDPRAKTSVTTWRVARAGTFNGRGLKEIRRDIEIGVDQFISDYAAVNTK
jgi:hypothetical protein